MKKLLILLMLALSLTACESQDKNVTPQENICVASTLAEARQICKVGELVYFEPSNWGNEQLPTMFIALACDTNKSTYFTKGGVVCTYVERKSINGKVIGDNKPQASETSSVK